MNPLFLTLLPLTLLSPPFYVVVIPCPPVSFLNAPPYLLIPPLFVALAVASPPPVSVVFSLAVFDIVADGHAISNCGFFRPHKLRPGEFPRFLSLAKIFPAFPLFFFSPRLFFGQE